MQVILAEKASNKPHDRTPDLQPSQDVNPNMVTCTRKHKVNKHTQTHSLRDNITPPITTFEQTKQIIIDIDKLLHCTTLHKKCYNH